ncbi:hypothetical protein [Adhaeribacter pallidiroseus]|uniref:hypothetical protein n=1 Tax=Adhaeribacter pallidiroseus TaxID=2072847 RepID=UPI000E1B7EAA|nr:hypothetical protein [Adhaeribacter pallidiroseus]
MEIGKMLPGAKVPYIINVQNKNKRLVLVGCQHVRVVNHPQFAQIQQYFRQLQPQITFNEGGPVNDCIR